jgi:hypothetical protein
MYMAGCSFRISASGYSVVKYVRHNAAPVSIKEFDVFDEALAFFNEMGIDNGWLRISDSQYQERLNYG